MYRSCTAIYFSKNMITTLRLNVKKLIMLRVEDKISDRTYLFMTVRGTVRGTL